MRLHALQYLRAIAALVVVYAHACIQVPAYSAKLMEFGSFGVDIFFVISGFIMLYISKSSHKPGAFMLNRIRRVAPLYWFFTLLMAVIFLIMPSVFAKADLTIESLLKSLFFIPHFSAAHPGEVWPIVAPGWSLNFEMYFYLLFALSLFAPEKLRLTLITVVISGVFLAATLADTGGPWNKFFTDNVVFEFIFGMLLAHYYKRDWRLSSALGWVLFVAGFVLLLLHSQHYLLAAFNLPGIITNGIPAAMIVAGTLFLKLPENRLGVLLGDASYALYLSHIFVLGLFRKVLPPVLGDGPFSAYLFVAISMIACLVISVPVHHLIDNWALRMERINALRSPAQREA